MPSATSAPMERLVARLTARSRLGASERNALLKLAASPSSVRQSQTLVRRGDAVKDVCLVVDGLVGSFYQARNGTRQIVALHIQGDMANLASMKEKEAGCDLEALTASVVVRVGHRELRAVVDAFPMLAAALWRDSVADARILSEWTFNIGSKTARSRLAHLFCELACRYEQAGLNVGLHYELAMTQDQLAEATAMTPVHLNRSLMGLRRDGVVEMRSKMVEILDWKAMTQIAEFDPRYLQFSE